MLLGSNMGLMAVGGRSGVSTGRGLVAQYTSPPVVEVSLAVSIEPLRGLGLIALGDLWREKYQQHLPNVEEQGVLTLPQEAFDISLAGPQLPQLERLSVPPLPRLWFVDGSGRELVQVQADLFARNWRDLEHAAGYPLYENLREAFVEDYRRFLDFAAKRKLGSVRPTQVEISYVNHIAEDNLSDVLTLISRPPGRMADPEGATFNSQYVLIRDGQRAGRLHIQATTAMSRASGQRIVALTITVRGRPRSPEIDGVMEFLDFGADEALEAFAASTRTQMHKKWGARG